MAERETKLVQQYAYGKISACEFETSARGLHFEWDAPHCFVRHSHAKPNVFFI